MEWAEDMWSEWGEGVCSEGDMVCGLSRGRDCDLSGERVCVLSRGRECALSGGRVCALRGGLCADRVGGGIAI